MTQDERMPPDRNCPACHAEMEHCVNVRIRDAEVAPHGWLCAKCQITVPWDPFYCPIASGTHTVMSDKVNYIGAPKCFALEMACRDICDAFEGYGCYLVGSALAKRDWRDVDVRFIMADEDFDKLFPYATENCWEQDTRWLLLTVSISEHLSKITGLPVDFQFQRQSHANDKHKGGRHAIGLRIAKSASVTEGERQGQK